MTAASLSSLAAAGQMYMSYGQAAGSCLAHVKSRTETPKVCKVMAFWAVFSGFGPLLCIVLGVQVHENAMATA